jgi:putative DNA primase/helicase
MTAKPSPNLLPEDLYIWKALSELGRASVEDWKRATGTPAKFTKALMRLRTAGCVKYEDKVFIPVREPAASDYAAPPPGSTKPPESPDKKWLLLARDFMNTTYPRKSKRLIYYRGSFYHWAGSHYTAIDDDAINSQIYMWMEKPARKPRDEVRSALQAMAHINRDLQAPTWLSKPSGARLASDYVVCKNGRLALSTGELEPHSSDFLTMNALPCSFDPNAKAPRWEQFVSEIWGDDDTASIEALQEWFGYFISRELNQQKIFMIIGPKRSGKGTIARVLKELLGGDKSVAAPPLANLKDKNGLECLIDKVAALIADVRLEGFGNHEIAERLLAISGQDAIDVYRKYKSNWHGTLGVRFLILSNNLPAFTDASGAIISRFMVLQTQQSFLGREDTKLTNKLLEELPGILNWALEGLRRLQARGHFVQPESAQENIDELENQASPVLAWGKAQCDFGPELTTTKKALVEEYEAWRGENKYSPIPRPHFFRQLRAAFPSLRAGKVGVIGAQQPCYRGIGLRYRRENKEEEGNVISIKDHRPDYR